MTLQECYAQLHGNYEEAKTRLSSDKLIERFILKYPNDPSMEQFRSAVKEGNTEDAFAAVHTLKGVAGNLSFTELHSAASELTEYLRGLDRPVPEELRVKLEERYITVTDVIEQYRKEL